MATIAARKKIRQKVTGSPNATIPTTAVPTAPIAVHTAYAVPSGMVFMARVNNQKLSAAKYEEQDRRPDPVQLHAGCEADFERPRAKQT